jgi:hypothetical protein
MTTLKIALTGGIACGKSQMAHIFAELGADVVRLKGQVGDEINVLMAACAWNLRKWLVITTIFLFWQNGRFWFVWNGFLRGD